MYACVCVYLSQPELALPGADAVLKGLLEGREGHALGHGDVVVQELGGLIRALKDVGACLLIGQYIEAYCRPFMLHLIQSLGGERCERQHSLI